MPSRSLAALGPGDGTALARDEYGSAMCAMADSAVLQTCHEYVVYTWVGPPPPVPEPVPEPEPEPEPEPAVPWDGAWFCFCEGSDAVALMHPGAVIPAGCSSCFELDCAVGFTVVERGLVPV